MDSLVAMQKYVERVNDAHGWYDGDPVSFVEACMLVNTELCEAVEAYRDGGMEGDALTPLPSEQLQSEVADVFIRTLDLCYRFNIDLADAFVKKMRKNEDRPYRHGNKII